MDIDIKKVLIGLATIIIGLAVIIVIRTFTYPFMEQLPAPLIESIEIDGDTIASHLSEAVRFQTISHQDPTLNDTGEILALHAWLQETYPLLHNLLKQEIVNEYSLLYTWEGQEPALKPVIFLAHMDVVPVESNWISPPFDGMISEGYVWGRGTLDMKGMLVAIMEAVEYQIANGHRPRRTIMLGFGHDEEIGGLEGAAKIAELLKRRNVRLQWVMDEGSIIAQGILPGIEPPVALIGVVEKGYVTLELVAEGDGGHSSMPPYDTAVSRLGRAITKLQQNQFTGGIDGVVSDMLDTLAPSFPLAIRAVIANRWFFGPLVERGLSWQYRRDAAGMRQMNALLRTTMAPTMLKGSPKENVLGETAQATVNFRIHPRDTVESVLEHVKNLFTDDPDISVNLSSGIRALQPSPESPTNTDGYKTIERTLREVFPESIVSPSLVLLSTDSRYFSDLADGVYRIDPFVLDSEQIDTIHGTNERVGVEALADAVRFYERLIDNID